MFLRRNLFPFKALSLGLLMVSGDLSRAQEGATPPKPTDPRILKRYRQMLEAKPTEGGALERLWKSAEAEGGTEALIEEYRIEAEKGSFSGAMIYGLLLARADRKLEAAQSFQKAADLNPESPLPYFALERLSEDRVQKAEALERAVARVPAGDLGREELLMRLGNAWMEAQQPEKAASTWEKQVELDPTSTALRLRLAGIYRKNGMQEPARRHYRFLTEKATGEERVQAWRDLAALERSAGQNEAALEALEQALALTSAEHWMRSNLISEIIGISLAADHERLLEARWKAAAEAQPKLPQGWLQLATLYGRLGEREQELAALGKASELLPGDFKLRYRLARLTAQNDPEKGGAMLEALLQEPPAAAQLGADLVFERALAEIRTGKEEAATRRITEYVRQRRDAAISARALAFFEDHRLLVAAEAQVREEGDAVAVADFLLRHRRDLAEVKEALAGLKAKDDSIASRIARHQKAAEILKQAGDPEGALEALRKVVELAPEDRANLLALGDALLQKHSQKAISESREIFSKAYALSKTKGELREADQRLFKAYTLKGGNDETPARETQASKMVARIFSAPTPDPAVREGTEGDLNSRLAELQKGAEKSGKGEDYLRWAQWELWRRNFGATRTALTAAKEKGANGVEALELEVDLCLAIGLSDQAVRGLDKLVEIDSARREEWLQKKTQLFFQGNQAERGLEVLKELAKSGSAEDLTTLANGYQQADLWTEALAIWERLFKEAKGGKRYEAMQPMVRALKRLGMHQRMGEVLWEIYAIPLDEQPRRALLQEMIVYHQEQGRMPELLERLKRNVEAGEGGPEAKAAVEDYVEALKKYGDRQTAYRVLERASKGAEDRAEAIAGLVREAEEMRRFKIAAGHQKVRISLLESAPVEEWERLAALEESALDYAAAGATWQQVVKWYPRRSEAVLKAARYFEKWGEVTEARRCLEVLLKHDPKHIEGLALYIQMGGEAAGMRRKAAERLLELIPVQEIWAKEGLVLPPARDGLENRMQASISALSGRAGVSMPSRRLPVRGLRGVRLSAIEVLRDAVAKEELSTWVKRWEKGDPSEKVWALYRPETKEPLLKFLAGFADGEGGGPGRSVAFIWPALLFEEWDLLGKWLWAPSRLREEQDVFRSLFGEWALLRKPFAFDKLFAGAAPTQMWLCAEMLASRQRLPDAITLGGAVFPEGSEAEGVRYRAKQGLTLAYWLLAEGVVTESGSRESFRNRAKTLLRAVALQPADSLETPTFAAQKLLLEVIPKEAREKEGLALLKEIQEISTTTKTPLFSALSEAFIKTLLGGDPETLWGDLMASRPMPFEDSSPDERAWAFVLTNGIRLQLWNLDAAAASLWEAALGDPAMLALQEDRTRAYISEVKMRLASIQGERTTKAAFRVAMERLASEVNPLNLAQLATLYEGAQCYFEAAQVLDILDRQETNGGYITRLLAACRASGEKELGDAAVKRWRERVKGDRASAVAVLEVLNATDPDGAFQISEEFARTYPEDFRCLEDYAKGLLKRGRAEEAASYFRRALMIQSHSIASVIGLADSLALLGKPDEAIEVLRKVPRRDLTIESALLVQLMKAGRKEEMLQSATRVLSSGEQITGAIHLASQFSQSEMALEGLQLLAAAVEMASEGLKFRAAYDLQAALLRAGAKANMPSETLHLWQRRLRSLAGEDVEMLSGYFRTLAEVFPPAEVERELQALWADGKGSALAGAWLLSVQMQQEKENKELAETILKRNEVPVAMLDAVAKVAESMGFNEIFVAFSVASAREMPLNSNALLQCVVAYKKDCEAAVAIEALKEIVEIGALEMNLLPRAAAVACQLGDETLAEQLLERSLSPAVVRGQAALFEAYVTILLERGDLVKAKRYLRKGLRRDRLNPALVAQYLAKGGMPWEEGVRELELSPEYAKEVEKHLPSKGR